MNYEGTFNSVAKTADAPLQAVEPEPEQLAWVHGFPAAGTRFTLVSTSNLWTDRKLEYNDVVRISGAARVKGVHTKEDKDKSILYVYDLEVNDCDIV